MLNLTTNALEVLADLDDIARDFPEVVESALDRAAVMVKQDEEREIQQTYDRRIPTREEYRPAKTKRRNPANGSKPAWSRKANNGGLIASVEVEKRPMERRVFIGGEPGKAITNYPGGYAERLTDLPDGPDGVNRSNGFAKRTVDAHAEQWVAVFEQDVLSALDE